MPNPRTVKASDCERFVADLRAAANRYREAARQSAVLHPDRLTHGDLLRIHKMQSETLLGFAEVIDSLADREERLMDTDGRRYQECSRKGQAGASQS